MNRKTIDYLKNDEGQWQAVLTCGHVVPLVGSKMELDESNTNLKDELNNINEAVINCSRCDKTSKELSTAIQGTVNLTIREAWEKGGISGLCSEGRFDLVIDRLNSINLEKVIENALRQNHKDR